ncbi:MAG: SMP-30/gluconolactonase/LRE family protein [Myxococcales bacterium]|nr:SMP-30/gluconolactonase/LRE family protein [Myxococcales bacterium]
MPLDVETLAHGFGLVEGPRMDPDGSLYFSDVTHGGVYRRAPDGSLETVVPKRKGVGGIALHAEGGLVISGRDVCHVKDGATRTLLERPEGVGGFNDLFVDATGRVLVGTLRSNPFDLGAEREPGECWRIDGEGKATVLYAGVGLSNGIGFSPDGRTLYHSDTAAGAVLAHDVDADGSVANRRVFAECDAPDGLAVDAAGGVWVASYGGGGVVRFDASGRTDRRVEVPAQLVSSCCFGGEDLRDLVVTSQDNTEAPERRGSIFRLRTDLPGLPPPLARV